MIDGFDISNNNPTELVESWIDLYDPKFCFMKASEGVTFKDKKMPGFYRLMQEKGILPGFYHFAKGGKNKAADEARNFLDAIQPYMEDGALLCLDIESTALRKSNEWIREWIDTVESEYGGKVIIYIQRSAFISKKKVFQDNGLWVASWGDNLIPPYNLNGYLIAFWQDGIRNGLDHDYFAGDMNQLYKYKCYRKG